MRKFDINNNSRHLNPYRVPEGFFDEFEANVMRRVDEAVAANEAEPLPALFPYKPSYRRSPLWLTAAAAVAAVILVVAALPLLKAPSNGLDAEIAFSNLSQTDQETILDSYDYLYFADDI